MAMTLWGGLTLTVRIALTPASTTYALWDYSVWDSGALWGPGLLWEDVSDYVLSVATNSAFSDRVNKWQASTTTIDLDNTDGRFSPENLTGPYATAGITSIIVGVPIDAYLTYNGVDYPLFRGYVSQWADSWHYTIDPQDGITPIGIVSTTVTAVDEWGRLGTADGMDVGSVGGGDSFGARINRILDAAGHTGPRDIDVGYTTMLATSLADKRLDEIEITVDSEGCGSSVYVGPDGTIIGRDRYSLAEDIRSITPQIIFGDMATEIPWSTVEISPLSVDGVINMANYQRVGGTLQTYVDPASIALYGPKGDTGQNTTNLVCETDAQVLAIAIWTVLVSKDPRMNITGLEIKPRAFLDECAYSPVIPQLLSLMLRDLVTVNARPPSSTGYVVSRDCFISGLSYTIDRGDMTMTLSTISAMAYRQYANSRWDVGLWGASDSDTGAARWFI